MTDAQPIALDRFWSDAALRKRLMREPVAVLREIGVALPEGITGVATSSRAGPDEKEPSLYQVLFERDRLTGYVFLPSPVSRAAQLAAFGRQLVHAPGDPKLEARFRIDLAEALAAIGCAPARQDAA